MLVERNLPTFPFKEKLSRWKQTKENRPATPSQLSAANLDQYCQTIAIFDQKADQYARQKLQRKGTNVIESDEYLDHKITTVTALDDLHAINGDETKQKQFQKEWGNQGQDYLRLYNDTKREIDEVHSVTLGQANKYHLPKRLWVSNSSLATMAFSPYEAQQEKALENAGFPPKTYNKLKQSGTIHGAGSLVTKIALGAGLAIGAANPILHETSDMRRNITLGISYAFAYGLAWWNAKGRMRTLSHKDIGTSSNFPATSLYMIAETSLPEDKNYKRLLKRIAKRGLVYGASFQGLVSEELVMAATMQIPEVGTSIVLARNVTLGMLGSVQRIGEEMWIHQKSKEVINEKSLLESSN